MLILACLFIFVLTIENFLNLVRAGRRKDDYFSYSYILACCYVDSWWLLVSYTYDTYHYIS